MCAGKSVVFPALARGERSQSLAPSAEATLTAVDGATLCAVANRGYAAGYQAFLIARATIVSFMALREFPSTNSGAGIRIICSNSSAGTGGLQWNPWY